MIVVPWAYSIYMQVTMYILATKHILLYSHTIYLAHTFIWGITTVGNHLTNQMHLEDIPATRIHWLWELQVWTVGVSYSTSTSNTGNSRWYDKSGTTICNGYHILQLCTKCLPCLHSQFGLSYAVHLTRSITIHLLAQIIMCKASQVCLTAMLW